MSRSTSLPIKIKELFTGIHLVMIDDISIVKGEDNMPIRQENGSIRLRMKFITGESKCFESDYWTKETDFLKMLVSFKVVALSDKFKDFKASALHKRGWICIKEVHLIDKENPVLDDQGQPKIDYYIFDTRPVSDSLKKPTIKGDPEKNDGIASEAFLDYKSIDTGTSIITEGNPVLTKEVTPQKKQLEKLKEIKKTVEDLKQNPVLPLPVNIGEQNDFPSRSQRSIKEEIKTPIVEQSKPGIAKAPAIGEIDWSKL